MSGRVSLVCLKVSNQAGTLFVVATPIGNLDDLSPRAASVLGAVDLIAAEDTRHSKRLLNHIGVHKPMMSLHEHNESEAAGRVISALESGQDVALVSDAGTPLISDPGFPLVRLCRARGLTVSPIPGACALVAALSVSGLPTDHFRFEGFMPRTMATRRSLLKTLAGEKATLVFYESSHRVLDSLADMVAELGEDRPAALARELSKQYETLLHGTLAELHSAVEADTNQQRGEFVLVVGGAPRVSADDDLPDEVLRLLGLLAEEMPLKQAAAITAKWSGLKKNRLYQAGLDLPRQTP